MSVAYRLLASEDGSTGPGGHPETLIFECSGADAASTEALQPLDRSRAYDLRISGGKGATLSNGALSLLAALKLASVARLDGSLYKRPARDGAKKALFVFPGVFVPPRIGSHQRAFSTVLDLVEGGYDVDVVVKQRGPVLLDRTRKYFDLIATNVFAYDEAPAAEQRKRGGRSIAESETRDVNDAGRRLIGKLLDAEKYDVVVVSYSWMVALLDGCPLGDAKLVCDTHDMVSNRQAGLAAQLGWFAAGADKSTAREKALLSRCDAVLAISESDKALFEKKLGLPNVVLHPLSFHRPADPALQPQRAGPRRFGFMGSDMEANRQSLRLVLDAWWPAIRRHAPDSTLTVAGAVTRSVPIPERLRKSGVTACPYVDDIDAFYDDVDALLSPATVQAGVNVKNVESLLRGCMVITNAVGARSLAPLRLPATCEDAKSAVGLIRRLDAGDEALTSGWTAVFEEARRYHLKPRPLTPSSWGR